MNGNNYATERSLRAIILELKQELKEFVRTRVEMLASELRTVAGRLAIAIPFTLLGALFLAIAVLLFVVALVAVVAFGFGGGALAWFFAFLIVGGLISILGGIAVSVGLRQFRHASLAPRKTIEVLRQDRLWLRKETEA